MNATNIERILRDQQEELFSKDESPLVTRREEQEFDLDSPLAQIVIGVRRCGKSTICQKVLKESNIKMQGGLPETLMLKRQDKYVASLLTAIINKDICQRYNVRYKKTLQQLANGMLDRFCQEISYSDVQHNYLLQSIHTAKNYVTYLENAYLLRLVPRYSFKSIERQNMRKAYSIDNAFVTNHDDALQTENLGWRLENTVAIELLRRMEHESQQLYYIRKNRKYKVDFAVTDRNKVTELIQVTYNFSEPKAKLYNREIGGLLMGSADTGCKSLTLIMMTGEEGDIQINGLTIHKVLACHWLTAASNT